jgi:hypothetical protein
MSSKLSKTSALILPKNHHVFTIVVTFIFYCLGLLGILNHAMWRDELNVWLIARDSSSLLELFGNIKYEGHPALWYLCLYFLNQFTSNPVAMQLFHLLIATGAVFVFIKYSPFTRLQKVLFCFGYLPFYEYLVISRNYAIGLLLVFAFCAVYPSRTKGYLRLALILFFLANSNAYGLFISIALGLTLIIEYGLSKSVNSLLSAKNINLIGSLIIFFLGIYSSLAQLIPPADSTLQGGMRGWTLQFDFKHLVLVVTRIWNSYIVVLIPGTSREIDGLIFAILSLCLFTFIVTLLIKKPVALFLYIFGTGEIILFTYVKFLGAARHYGHLYILLIASLWIASYYPKSNLLGGLFANIPSRFKAVATTWAKFVKKYKNTLFMLILYAQLTGGIVAFSRDLLIPYSASREAARYIQSQHLEQMFIVGSRDANISPLSGYLNRKIYYPERQGMGSFVLFNSQRKDVDSVAVLEQVSQIIKQKQTNILLILNYELKTAKTDLNLWLLAKFTKSFIGNEKYYLYQVNPATKSVGEIKY